MIGEGEELWTRMGKLRLTLLPLVLFMFISTMRGLSVQKLGLRMGRRALLSLHASGGNTGAADDGKDKSSRSIGFGTSQPSPAQRPSIYEQAKLNDYKKLQGQYDSGDKRVLDDTVDFPSEFTIKIIGLNEESFATDIVNAVSAETGIMPEAMKVSLRKTSGKNYISITLIAQYANADEVYAAYECIGKDSRVKFVI